MIKIKLSNSKPFMNRSVFYYYYILLMGNTNTMTNFRIKFIISEKNINKCSILFLNRLLLITSTS